MLHFRKQFLCNWCKCIQNNQNSLRIDIQIVSLCLQWHSKVMYDIFCYIITELNFHADFQVTFIKELEWANVTMLKALGTYGVVGSWMFVAFLVVVHAKVQPRLTNKPNSLLLKEPEVAYRPRRDCKLSRYRRSATLRDIYAFLKQETKLLGNFPRENRNNDVWNTQTLHKFGSSR